MSKQILIWRDQLNQPNKNEESWINIQNCLKKLKEKKEVSLAVLEFISRQSTLLEIYPKIINELSKNFQNDCQHLRQIYLYFQTAYKIVSFFSRNSIKFVYNFFSFFLATRTLFYDNSIVKNFESEFE